MVAHGGAGHAWLLTGGMHGCSGGACMVAPGGVCGCSGGMRGCSQGVCMVAPRGVCVFALGECAWLLWGACVVALGGACMVALGGCVWLLWGGMRGCSGGRGACMVAPGGGMRGIRRHTEIRSMSGRYASYWNAFLLFNGKRKSLDTLLDIER